MRIIVETATDVAAVAVADPTLIGALREARDYAQFVAVRSQAEASGALWRTDTGADGAYLFHIFLEEEPPSDLRRQFEDPISMERFRVPSGRLVVAGEECLAGSQALSPALGQEVEVPAGTYRLTAFRVEDRDDVTDRRWKTEAPPEQQRAWRIGNSLAALSVIAVLAAIVGAVVLYLATSSVLLAILSCTLPLLVGGWSRRYRRGALFRAAEDAFRKIEREMPSIVLVLARGS
jgi:hypothetical protein